MKEYNDFKQKNVISGPENTHKYSFFYFFFIFLIFQLVWLISKEITFFYYVY